MSAPYIPAQNVLFAGWSANFSAVISANPLLYGITVGQAATYAALDALFQSAYTTATTPATRTPVACAAMVDARNAAEQNARQLASLIQANPAITDPDLSAAGLTVRAAIPTPVPAPVTRPIIQVAQLLPLGALLRWSDELTPDSKAKPAGVVAGQLFYKIGDPAPLTLDECRFAGLATKVPFTLDLPSAAGGEKVHLVARWATRRGLYGPTSAPVNFICQPM